jgi:hypothetical protein
MSSCEECLSFFADIGTKKERTIITWRYDELCPRIVKAIFQGTQPPYGDPAVDGMLIKETGKHRIALLAAFLDSRFKAEF